MFITSTTVFKKDNYSKTSFSLVESNLVCLFKADNIKEEEVKIFFNNLKEALLVNKTSKLAAFDNTIDQEIKSANFPVSFDFAAVYLIENKLLIKTVGSSVIFIKRQNNFAKLISGNNIAAGFVNDDDNFLLTTDDFLLSLGGEKEIGDIVKKNKDNLIDELNNRFGVDIDKKIAIFMSVRKELDDGKIIFEKNKNPIFEKFKNYWTKRQIYSKNKKSTLIIVLLIAVIFIWSVGLGYKRKTEALLEKKITQAKELIVQKTDQAEEVALINLPRAQILIKEASDILKKLKNEIKDAKRKDIGELEEIINNKEALIVKKEEKNYEEFFDLTIDNESAKGSQVYLDKDKLLILDKEKSTIFSLSLEKKSLTKNTYPEIGSAELIAGYEDAVYFFNSSGIYKIENDGKPTKEIDKDKDWGEIKDMNAFNGNLYLLDKSNDEIYKYVPAETGYSEKSSYFKAGQAVGLDSANSFTIDLSLYIGFKDYIFKFTSGLRDGFKTDYPEEGVNLTKIFTDKNLEKIYAWDKSKGIIYILAKDGTYEKQIKSKILSTCNDMVVFNDDIYLIVKSKIFRINL